MFVCSFACLFDLGIGDFGRLEYSHEDLRSNGNLPRAFVPTHLHIEVEYGCEPFFSS